MSEKKNFLAALFKGNQSCCCNMQIVETPQETDCCCSAEATAETADKNDSSEEDTQD